MLDQNQSKIISFLLWIMLALGIIGFADATFITIEHYLGTIPPCSVISGCEYVLTSQYATVLGIPLALYGALYYFCVTLLVQAYISSRKKKLLIILHILTMLGFLASLYFIYLQLYVIKAICIYCMISAVTSTLLFICGGLLMHMFRPKQ